MRVIVHGIRGGEEDEGLQPLSHYASAPLTQGSLWTEKKEKKKIFLKCGNK